MKKDNIIKICHITSVHPFFDIRIFYKECKSLTEEGYEVHLIADHSKDEIIDGIHVHCVKKHRNRYKRILFTTYEIFRETLKIDASVYHFHDPELIFIGLLLKLKGKKVIYDVHEAYTFKIPQKKWIKPQIFRNILSKIFPIFERVSSKCFDYLIAADKVVAENFTSCKKVKVIANYPLLTLPNKIKVYNEKYKKKNAKFTLIYSGATITGDRGLYKMLEAMNYLKDINIELHLVGNLENTDDERIITKMKNVFYFGFLPIEKMFALLLQADIGLVLFQSVPAYFYAGKNTTKLFEYMICGLPVIASNFPNLKKIVEDARCGICIDSTNPEYISQAVKHLYNNPDRCRELGKNGKEAVLKKYNWESESVNLINIYKDLLTGTIK